jgi:uncharacterized protein (UPF0332 family)
MSERSFRAAQALRKLGNHRSCVSRAYYAAFAAVTSEVRKHTLAFPNGYEHPPHARIGAYVRRYLVGFSKTARRNITDAVIRLREARVYADYRQHPETGDAASRNAMGDARFVLATQICTWDTGTLMTKKAAIQLVEKYLQRHPPKEGYNLHVDVRSSHEEDGWWIISVGADREMIRPYDFYDILAQVEREVQDERNAPIAVYPAPARRIAPRKQRAARKSEVSRGNRVSGRNASGSGRRRTAGVLRAAKS